MVRNDIIHLFYFFFLFNVECYGTIAVLPGLTKYIINNISTVDVA